MAINLLSPNLQANATAKAGGSPYTPNNIAGVGGMNIAPKISTPMGVTATSPTVKAPAPPTTLPKPQQNPIVSNTIPTTSTAPVQPTTPQTQYSNDGKSVGTQLPGMAGFNPQTSTPSPAQTTVYQNGVPTTVQNSTANVPISQTPTTSTPTSFSGLLGAAVNQQNSPYNQSAQASIAGTQGASQATYGQGYNNATNYSGQANDAIQKLQGLQSAVAQGDYNIQTTPMLGQFQQGREQALQQMYGGQESALANEISSLGGLYGTAAGQQGTGISGLNSAGNSALTGQGQVQGALQSAAGLAQPNQASYGQTVFNPVTGQYEDGGGLPAATLQQYAQMAANGQYSAIPSSITGNIALNAQLNQAAKALNPNYNPITSQAQGAAQSSNVQTAGTFGTNTAAQGGSAAVQQYNALNAANSTFDNQASQVLSVLSDSQLNGSIPDVNKALNSIGGRFGSTQVQALSSALTELGAAYTNLLSSNGGTPTAQDQQALATLSPNSSAAQIATSIAQLKQAAQIKLQSQASLAQGYTNSLGGSSTSGTSNGTITVQAADGNSYGFHQDASGKWVAG